jgi:hypothetical protein
MPIASQCYRHPPRRFAVSLWFHWLHTVALLRPACSRKRTFLWMTLVLAAFCVRSDLVGVFSFVRATFIGGKLYHALLALFHSRALDLDALLRLWARLTLTLFSPVVVKGFVVLLADGIKAAKEGRKMPAVKSLHQESADNSKPPYIMGHSFQALALLVQGATTFFAVPLVSRIHEGLVFSNRDKRTLLDKLATLFCEVADIMQHPSLLVADAYYASRKIITPLFAAGHHLIAKAKITCVAYLQVTQPAKRPRGRPKLYGPKVRLRDLFKEKTTFQSAPSPVYGEHNVTLSFRCVELVWRPVGRVVKFVLVNHPTRGKIVLLCTFLALDALTIIWLYGLRFKIEVSFKQAVWTLGTYAYHFWMKAMQPIKRRSGNQYLHRRSEEYRQAVRRKMDAYHRYVALACIAQGLLQYLAVNFRGLVWDSFHSCLRTMNTDCIPSEQVTAQALRATFPHFLLSTESDAELRKFILDRADYDRLPGWSLAA